MRGALALIALSLVACGDPPPTTFRVLDVGVDPFRDAGPPPDAFELDAFHFPDTGPPVPPVLPAQSWTFHALVSSDEIDVTVDLDARAESGIVRAVAGGGGHSSTVIFDISPGGVLSARSPVRIGLAGPRPCSADTLSIDQLVLQFADSDGDGIHETLSGATSGSTVTRSGAAFAPTTGFESVFVRSVAADTTAPTLAVWSDAFAAQVEPFVLVASEPIVPAFMPRLVGPRTIYLQPEIGASAAARWTLPMGALPTGHYDLVTDGASDLAGMGQTTPFTVGIDVAPLAPPPIDDTSPGIVAVLSGGPTIILGDDPGEVALNGTTSILTTGRTVIVFDATAGRRSFELDARFEGPSTASSTAAYLALYDAHGMLVGQSTIYQYFVATATVPGFDLESTAQYVITPFSARTGRYYAVLDPGGASDLACTGTPPVPGIGTTLDQLTIH